MKNYRIENGILYDYRGTASQPKIPNGVTEIGSYSFSHGINITSIKIPNSVNTICSMAFAFCSRLESVKIPKSVSYIGCNAFDGIRDVKTQYTANKIRAFKAFRRDWTCRDFKYKVGKSFHQDGIICCCRNGFHACTNPLAVFNHYEGNLNKLRFAEVEMSGDLDFKFDKVAASDIRIVRELTASELADIYNSMEKF